MRKVVWSPSAVEDLEAIFETIQGDSPSRAREWVKSVVRSAGRLAHFPRLGRLIPEIGRSRYREIILGEHRLFHEVREKEILIFRILHSKRLFPD